MSIDYVCNIHVVNVQRYTIQLYRILYLFIYLFEHAATYTKENCNGKRKRKTGKFPLFLRSALSAKIINFSQLMKETGKEDTIRKGNRDPCGKVL